jgi:hypothetical protein
LKGKYSDCGYQQRSAYHQIQKKQGKHQVCPVLLQLQSLPDAATSDIQLQVLNILIPIACDVTINVYDSFANMPCYNMLGSCTNDLCQD